MTYFEAFLYGAVQGLTEYLPISSSAHLILLPKFLGTQDPGLAFDVFLHLGTLIATLVYFREDWIRLVQDLFQKKKWVKDGNSPRNIILVTLPAVFFGLILHRAVETHFRANWIQAAALTVGGILLWWVDRSMKQTRTLESVNWKTSLSIGFFQVLALIPGMSRSGSTMMGGRFLGLKRESAARFSFLASTPITAAALIYELKNWRVLFESAVGVGPMLVAGISSFVFGWLAIDRLLKWVAKSGFGVFAVYRVLLAVIVIAVLGY